MEDSTDLKKIKYILIVEDDIDLRFALSLCLQEVGYKVLGVGNGLEAIKILSDPHRINHPGLILLDLEMPIMNGWEFIHVFRHTDDDIQSIPLIVTTAHTCPKVSYQVISKPYILDSLIKVVKETFPPQS